MEPIEFPEQTIVLAKDQPQYKPLPVHLSSAAEGYCISCWKPSWRDRWNILRGRPMWLSMMTFGSAPMPVLPTTEKHDIFVKTNTGKTGWRAWDWFRKTFTMPHPFLDDEVKS